MGRIGSNCLRCIELEREIEWLKDVVADLVGAVKRLEEENRSLRAQLNLSSKNSGRPPSTDPPGTDRPKRTPSGRKPGGQPGHEGTSREPLPPEEVDRFVSVHPEKCGGCGSSLSERTEDPSPVRRQVIEIPPVKPVVTEYLLHAAVCGCCGRTTRADLPPGVPNGAFGPRLTAIVAVLSGAYRMSKRNIEEILADLFGAKISLGSVSNIERMVGRALAESFEELRSHVKSSPVVHADETSWRIEGKRAWLWAAVVSFATVFLIRRNRSREVARELIGESPGILVSDRYSAYGWVPVRRRQVCWAHLIRDFRRFADRGGEAARIGSELLEHAEDLFLRWRRLKSGGIERSSFKVYVARIRGRVKKLLLDGTLFADERTAGTCREILAVESALWTFARIAGVEPTNNAAEQGIRPAVIWRKTSFGTWSEEGSRFAERILTAAATLRRQGRNVLEYVTEACRAALHGERAPSLLPVAAEHARRIA